MVKAHKFASDYGEIDAKDSPEPFIKYLQAILANDQFRSAKAEMHGMIGIHPTGRYLEVGCGTGWDVAEVARKLTPPGEAVGVDLSEGCLRYARETYGRDGLPVRFEHGSAENLGGDPEQDFVRLEDDTFDGTKIDRVLMHVQRPEQAIAELARVTKPGGVVVAAEPDWSAMLVDSDMEDVALRISAAACRPDAPAMPSPLVGRELYAIFSSCGLRNLAVRVFNITFISLEEFRTLIPIDAFVAHALDLGAITRQEARAFRANIAEKGRAERFFANYTLIAVRGEV